MSPALRLRLQMVGQTRMARTEVIAALGKRGVVVAEDASPRTACLVVGDQAGGSCVATVREASLGGARVVVARPRHPPDRLSWDLLDAGASDVIVEDEPASIAGAISSRLLRWDEVDAALESRLVRDHLIGSDPVWWRVLAHAVEIAMFSAAPTLLTGETGTGKELVSRLIHALDRRAPKGDLIVLDCTTVVPSLSGSEFFGHEKGAFTGATASREGAFALADGGTLFLDEIGELRLELQAELLRVFQEGTYKPVGGSRWRATDFRLVCATHRDLREMVERGSFRSDLFHRIAANEVHLPRLEDRPGDILPLATAFLAEHLGGTAAPPFDRATATYLCERQYPGNVRDLRQLIARVAVRYCGAGPVTVGLIPPDDRPTRRRTASQPIGTGEADSPVDLIARAIRDRLPLKEIKDLVRDEVIGRVYAEETAKSVRGAIGRTARRLDVSERLVQQWKYDASTGGTDLAAPRS
jgi:transcriptional regulator with GAF, ATPase, and Fis domain